MNVVIMSGVPGSGKSYQTQLFAKEMLNDGEDGVIVSADHYWCGSTLLERLGSRDYTGVQFSKLELVPDIYEFDPAKLSIAHQKCMFAFIGACLENVPTIVVDNTNIHNYEIAPYYLVGEAMGYSVEINRVEATLETCKERNTHNVPDHVIEKMHEVFSKMMDHPWIPDQKMPDQHMPWWATV